MLYAHRALHQRVMVSVDGKREETMESFAAGTMDNNPNTPVERRSEKPGAQRNTDRGSIPRCDKRIFHTESIIIADSLTVFAQPLCANTSIENLRAR